MTSQTLLEALGLPPSTQQDTRVGRDVLLEQLPTARQRTLVRERMEQLVWTHKLSPASCAIAAYTDPVRDYSEVQVMHLRVRSGAKLMRLPEHIHQAVAYPIVLISEDAGDVQLSLAPLRRSLKDADLRVFEEDGLTSVSLPAYPAEVLTAFAKTIGIGGRAHENLYDLYRHWMACVDALQISGLTGAFTYVAPGEALGRRRAVFAKTRHIDAEIAAVQKAGERERQTRKLAELNLRMGELRRERDKALMELGIA